MTRNGHAPSGFTLVEVALALGVAGFALVAILGLVPIGLQSNQATIEQTTAAAVASSVVADLRATPLEIPPAAKDSPRYQIPLPATGTARHTLFVREDGSAASAVNTDASPAQEPRFRVTLFITAPSGVTQKDATTVRLLVTWPALADPVAAAVPAKYAGAFEAVTCLNRH